MFDSANLDHRIDKAAFRREARTLRDALLLAQYGIKENGTFPVVLTRTLAKYQPCGFANLGR